MTAPVNRLLIASLTNHLADGRVARQIETLREQYTLVSAGTTPSGRAHETLTLQPQSLEKDFLHRFGSMAMLLVHQFERHYWSRAWVQNAECQLRSVAFDAMIVNDLPLLPVALKVAGQRPVAFDAHEYYPRQREDERRFRVLMRPYYNAICKRYLPMADTMFTVSPGLASEYAKEFGVRAVVVRNAPSYQELQPTPVHTPIQLVYHGVAQQRRNVESVIDVVRQLEGKCELHLMIQSRESRVNALRERASGCRHIHFHPPVPNHEVVQTINQFDLGIAFFPPVTFNLKYCLPNKLFEYIQARLGVIVGPSPDMADVVESTGCGLVTNDFSVESLKQTLSSLTPENVSQLKQHSGLAAGELCWERESQAITRCCHRMFSESKATHSLSSYSR